MLWVPEWGEGGSSGSNLGWAGGHGGVAKTGDGHDGWKAPWRLPVLKPLALP